MAELAVRGKLVHMPGPWGDFSPAVGVSVAMVDLDLGNASDTLWTGNTDAQGDFAGTLGEWRDSRSITVGKGPASVTTTVFDPSDVLALSATLSQRIAGRLFSVALPYAPAIAGLPTPVIPLPWGPPGLLRLAVDGAPVLALNQFANVISGMFTTGTALANYQVSREITLFGHTVTLLRAQLAGLDGAIQGLVASIEDLRRRQNREGHRIGSSGGAGNMLAQNLDRAAQRVDSLRKASVSGVLPAGQDPWEPIRHRLLVLVDGLTASLRQAAAAVDHAARSHVAPLAAQIAQTIVAAVRPAIVDSLRLQLLAAQTSVNLVLAITTLIGAVPYLLSTLGFGAAAADVSTFMNQDTWFGATLTAITVLCSVILLMLTSPIDGWSWLVEELTGADGVPGLRFVFSH
jgi:hypothetical protein